MRFQGRESLIIWRGRILQTRRLSTGILGLSRQHAATEAAPPWAVEGHPDAWGAAGMRHLSAPLRQRYPAGMPKFKLPPGFHWENNDYVPGALWLYRDRGMLIVGSIFPRITDRWVCRINRHRLRDQSAIAPRRDLAIRWVELWCRARAAHLESAEKELLPGRSPPLRTWRTGGSGS